MPDKPPSSARAGFPASPCSQTCTLNDQDLCLGCKRSLAEIVAWGSMTADQQWEVIGLLTERRL
ncbi:MAG: DUF1289 domain-containing protein [Gammaproteobacteria bacterium]|nr:MAG: DUF1289 domain-containing protein [Gammaproteobacteria bacterium]